MPGIVDNDRCFVVSYTYTEGFKKTATGSNDDTEKYNRIEHHS